jgi:hypothetical protein
MIRAIQRGTTTIQGPVIASHHGPAIQRLCVRYEGAAPVFAEFAKIRGAHGVVYGRLIESKRQEAGA